jgi:hypothetical protein
VLGWQLPQVGNAVLAYSTQALEATRTALGSGRVEKGEYQQQKKDARVSGTSAKSADTPAQQNLNSARASLDAAVANAKANPSKSNQQAVDNAQGNYNTAAAARVAEIKGLLNGGNASAGSSKQESGAANNPADYASLVAELKTLGGLSLNAPAPVTTAETEPNNTAATANTLNLATQNVTVVGGAINPGADQDWFKITVAAGAKAWVLVDTGGPQNAGATSRDSQVTIFQSDGTTQVEFDDDDGTGTGADGTIETGLASAIAGRTLTAAGDYLIKVNAFSATGIITPYKMYVVVTTAAAVAEVEGNDTAATANAIVTNAQTVGQRSGSIGAGGDLDFYSVQATAGNVLFVSADTDPERDGTNTDLAVQVRDTNGTTVLLTIDSSIGGSNPANPEAESASFTVPVTGTYYVVARHFSATGTGTYNLLVAAANSDAVSNQVCPPSPISSNLGVAGGNFAKTSGVMTQRLNRDGVVSSCGVGRAQNAPITATRTYDKYTLTNSSGATVCITINLTVLEQAASNYQVGAFSVFVPTNLTSGWLGDPGLSSGIPPTVQSFGVNIAAGASFDVVVFNTNATGDGNAYQLNVFGLPGCVTPPCGITCPANVTVSNDANQCGAVVTYAAPTTTGVCNTVTCSPASGSFFPKGTTTVTCTSSGNSNGNQSCSFTVTVNDTQPPAITCPANISVGTTGSASVVTYPAPVVSDNCPGILSATCVPASGSSFGLGTTTVTCTVKDAVNNTATCSFAVTVNKVTPPSVSDPLACTGPGNVVNGSFGITNNGNAATNVSAAVSLTPNLLGLPGTCVVTPAVGTCTVTNSGVTYSATLAQGQSVTVAYKLQVADGTLPGAVLMSTLTASFNGGPTLTASGSTTATCQAPGPGPFYKASSELTDQKAGSVLVYPYYTSAVGTTSQDSRISITNTHPNLLAYVHLFFVSDNCAVSDAYLCLTPNQTSSFMASDLDPGTSGYLVAVVSDATGCPINFNYLIGDEYVKLTSGHAANLGAQAIAGIAGSNFWASCNNNSVSATLRFNGADYNRLPYVVAVDNIGSRADGNDTIVVLDRIGGDLRTGPSGLGNVFGVFYDDGEASLSFTLNSSSCQYRFGVNNTVPRITPRFEQFVPAGRTGWMRMYQRDGNAMLGAVLNFNANAGASAGAFTQGHNLHVLTLTDTATYIIPIFPPSC